ncbi:membrane protein [Alkaliphilus oremlandii OhILAs]|uniref:Membrane protein n=2 Tax=Alkaliphilus oremlandii TaxID=461876 RepID=A8MF93_ALKOO|nr:membrane protein [Alkaliphilus oremlandii OhILAs]
MVLSGFLMSMGILLPWATSHAFGVPGTVLLPMHLPILILGLVCGPFYGALGGVMVPVLSSILTGMPPSFPMLPIMIGELTTYGFICGMMHFKLHQSIFTSLVSALICGRITYAVIFTILFNLAKGPFKALSVSAAFITGLPGIAIQLILIPIVVRLIHRYINASHLEARF